MARKNVYSHCIELKDLKIKNAKREDFAEQLRQICYRGYKVEDIADGRKIVITKPGGKRSTFGQPMKEDFLVFVYNPKDDTLWQITHKQILQDLEAKALLNPVETIKIIQALKKVYDGQEPDEVIKNVSLSNPVGEKPEVLLKVYKWIWGQEDVNYPNLKGRALSLEGIEELYEKINKSKP